MSITVNVNGESISYPQIGDTGWGDEATNFAVQTSAAFAKLGLSSGTSVDIPGNLDVTGNTTIDGNLTVSGSVSISSVPSDFSVGGNLTVTGSSTLASVSSTSLSNTGNTTLGNDSLDTLTINGTSVSIPNGLNIDSNTIVVDATNNRIGINVASPSVALDITGDVKQSGVIFNSDGTISNPSITFTNDPNTGIYRSGADTLDFVTNGQSRFRVEPTGLIKAVYESQVGTDYNTTLHNGYFCRAFVNFNGTGTVAIRASGNVSSITDNGSGDYTVNFTTALPDADYSTVYGGQFDTSGSGAAFAIFGLSRVATPQTTTSVRIITGNSSLTDIPIVNVAVFR